ncbi:MAG: GWxTD domain-containing protein [Acidobacteria bacterium]|nr:GWxTD domain-containing protein [Acidobacteriota bacterium]
MMPLEGWVKTAVSEALGWALVHSLWQGAAAAALLRLLAAGRGARVRYWLACAALLAIVVSFGLTFWHALPPDGMRWARREIPAPIVLPDAAGGTARPAAFPASEVLGWLTPFWLVGAVLFQMRVVGGWVGTRRLRRVGVCEAPRPWKQTLAELAARMRVSRPVQLLESSLAAAPVVIGYLRPAILVPAGLLAGLPPDQVEAILLHELAHSRRHDYLINLLQAVVEALFFYHPAVWWISGFVRAEREHCCDDLAVAATGRGVYEYALALEALERNRCLGTISNENAAVVAATGGNLVKRIGRLLYPAARPAPAMGWVVAPVLVVVALACAGAFAGFSMNAAAAQSPAEADPYRKWVNEDVVYIIEAREREAFVRLKTDDERKRFIEQFWMRRATARAAAEKVREEHYRRIAYCNDLYRAPGKAGWRTDRGKIYIVHGPPDEIESYPSGKEGGPPFERWMYKELPGIGKKVIVEYVDAGRTGEYRQTMDPANKK